jgi:hypothetical protein
MDESVDKLIDQVQVASRLIDRQTVKLLAKTIFLLRYPSYGSNLDLDAKLSKQAQCLNLEAPPPLVFADTNWPQSYFSFLVNPATLQIELWRTNKLGTKGFSMSSWKIFFDGTSKSIWSILTQPHEYAFHQ